MLAADLAYYRIITHRGESYRALQEPRAGNHSALLCSFQNAAAVMKSAKVNAHFALERPESFLLGAPRHRCGVCSVKFDSLHLDKEEDICRCCSHSLRIAQFPAKTSTLTAAAACVEWSATVRRLAEDTQMRKVLATRLEYRKDGSDATEYCREAKSLAERLEQLVRSSKWLTAILEAMTPTQSQYDSFAVKNTSFHELYARTVRHCPPFRQQRRSREGKPGNISSA